MISDAIDSDMSLHQNWLLISISEKLNFVLSGTTKYSKSFIMQNTQETNFPVQSIHHHEYRSSTRKKVRFHLTIHFKRKFILTEKMKAISEEFLAWILTIAAITLIVLF